MKSETHFITMVAFHYEHVSMLKAPVSVQSQLIASRSGFNYVETRNEILFNSFHLKNPLFHFAASLMFVLPLF